MRLKEKKKKKKQNFLTSFFSLKEVNLIAKT